MVLRVGAICLLLLAALGTIDNNDGFSRPGFGGFNLNF